MRRNITYNMREKERKGRTVLKKWLWSLKLVIFGALDAGIIRHKQFLQWTSGFERDVEIFDILMFDRKRWNHQYLPIGEQVPVQCQGQVKDHDCYRKKNNVIKRAVVTCICYLWNMVRNKFQIKSLCLTRMRKWR